MKGFRCDQCGQWRDGEGSTVTWDVALQGDEREWSTIDLCPDCAPEVIAPLEAIAKTEGTDE